MPRAAQVAFTDDFLLDDGTLAFPGYDITPLKSDPTIDLVRVPGGAAHRPGDLGGVDILVSVPHMAAIESRSLEGAESLLAIVRVGVGYEDVDVEACSQAGVAVVVPSDAVRRPTAVAALTLLLALATRLVEKDRLSRNGPQAWEKRAQLRGRNLQGRVLGLVGCGGIGSDFAKLVKPLGMRVIASDPQLDDAAAAELGLVRADLDTVLAEADYVSLHCPLNEGTRHLIDGQRLARMKPGACLINTARGGVVDQAALANALRSGHLGGAGLDVFEPEPLAEDDPLLSTQNVVLSAHALNWTEELDADMAGLNTAAIRDLLCGRLPKRIVNPAVLNNEAFTRKLISLSNRSTDDHSTGTSAKPRETQCA
jgi:D-3-phosphoglycerate dehydrogenase